MLQQKNQIKIKIPVRSAPSVTYRPDKQLYECLFVSKEQLGF